MVNLHVIFAYTCSTRWFGVALEYDGISENIITRGKQPVKTPVIEMRKKFSLGMLHAWIYPGFFNISVNLKENLYAITAVIA